MHEADGHAEFLKEVAREEIADRGESADGLRSRQLPARGGDGARRRGSDGLPNPDVANQRITGEGDIGIGAGYAARRLPRARTRIDGEFHVGLSRAEPHVADHDVLQGQGVFPGHDQIGADGAGGESVEDNNPTPVGRSGDGVTLTGEGHDDFFTHIGRAPNRDGPVALQNRVVGKQRRKGDVGAGA